MRSPCGLWLLRSPRPETSADMAAGGTIAVRPRALYDGVATATKWVTYDMAPEAVEAGR